MRPMRQSKRKMVSENTSEFRKPPSDVTSTTGAAFSTSLSVVVATAVSWPRLF